MQKKEEMEKTDKVDKISTEGLFERSDKGGTHRKPKHDEYRILMYNFAGVLEAEFEGISDAVANNGVGGTYHGILGCVQGRLKKHAGKIWRRG